MLHLSTHKLFENKNKSTTIEEYFKSKIDWKLYNYIQSMYTKFEDIGFEINIQIGYTSAGYGNYIPVFNGELNKFIEGDVDRLQRLEYFYNNKPMEYHISIRHDTITDYYATLREICEKVSKKFIIIYNISSSTDYEGEFYGKAVIKILGKI